MFIGFVEFCKHTQNFCARVTWHNAQYQIATLFANMSQNSKVINNDILNHKKANKLHRVYTAHSLTI